MMYFLMLNANAGAAQPRLPVAETYGVLGETDVVEASPTDPILQIVDPAKSSVTALPATLAADGIIGTTVTVTLRSEDGSLISGAQVNLESNRGTQDTIETVRGITGPDGQAIFIVRSLESGTLILTAYAGTRILDSRATVKFTEVAAAGVTSRMVWAGLGAILLIIFFQYLFARIVLSARSRAEQELFFHHPQLAAKSASEQPK